MKRKFYSEASYLLGLLLLAAGTAMMTRADFGVSMVVAPAYILYLKLSEFWSFMTFGIAEYILQAFVLLLLTLVVRKFKVSYLFSFVTTIVYGLILDASMLLMNFVPTNLFIMRLAIYIIGFLITSAGVSLLFNTYLSPAAYELFVKEVSSKYNLNMSKCKTIYDCTSCIIAIILSFLFYGLWQFEGVKIGTIICALLNGILIGMFSSIYNKCFETVDRFPKLKKLFC